MEGEVVTRDLFIQHLGLLKGKVCKRVSLGVGNSLRLDFGEKVSRVLALPESSLLAEEERKFRFEYSLLTNIAIWRIVGNSGVLCSWMELDDCGEDRRELIRGLFLKDDCIKGSVVSEVAFLEPFLDLKVTLRNATTGFIVDIFGISSGQDPEEDCFFYFHPGEKNGGGFTVRFDGTVE